MNNEIKKENPMITESDVNSISESKKSTTFIDLRNDFVSNETEKRKQEISQNEKLHKRPDYPFEENPKARKRRSNPVKRILTVPPAVSFSSIPMGRRPGMMIGYSYSYGGANIAGVSDTFSTTGGAISERVYVGNYGIIKFSDTYKDGPLVFVVGGIAIENDSWHPGLPGGSHKEGYMWEQGFNNLNNFHVYNCKKSSDAGNGWKECLSILSSKSIQVTKKILVGFSAGADNMYQVLRQEPASNWSVIHIIGAWMPNSDDADKHVNMIKGLKEPGRVFYFQRGGLDVESEGATVSNKKKIGAVLPSSNIINTQSHNPDGPKSSSDWIRKTIKLNGTTTITVGGKSVVVNITSGGPIKLDAKLKGQGGSTSAVVMSSSNYQAGKGSPYIASEGHANKGWKYKLYPPSYDSLQKGNSIGNALGLISARNSSKYENGKLPLSELVEIPGEGKDIFQLMHKSAAPSYLAMREAAKKDGINLDYTNCYRTFEKQMNNWFVKGAAKYPNHVERGRWYARPKFIGGKKNGTREEVIAAGSNHGFGKAIDVTGAARQQWINMNGDRFGWYWGDAPSEDWHFVYVL